MIVCLAEKEFLDLMSDERLHLPRRWDGRNFEIALADVLDTYVSELRSYYEANQEQSTFSCVNVNIPEIASADC